MARAGEESIADGLMHRSCRPLQPRAGAVALGNRQCLKGDSGRGRRGVRLKQ